MSIPSAGEQSGVGAPLKTDFMAAQRANRRATLQLLLVLTLIAGAMGYLIGWTLEAYGVVEAASPSGPSPNIWFISAMGLAGGGGLMALSGVWSGVSLAFGDRMVMSSAGGKEVTREQEPMLHNIVEEMAIAAGMPKPKVYVLETDVPNAFATGLRPDRAAIGITRGLLAKLDRDELQGVIGHEMAHIANADTRYLTVVAVTVGLISMIANGVLRVLRYGRFRGGGSGRKGGGAIILLLLLLVFAALAPIAARLVQFAVSRQREYLADATAVQFTRYPNGLASALQKLEAMAEGFPGASKANQHMFIVNPLQRFGEHASALFSTHPSTHDRIKRLMNLGS